MAETENQQIWDVVQLKEKELEPDRHLDTDITRNLQLGNWPRKDMIYVYHQLERAINLQSFPQNRNGWLYHGFGLMTKQKVNSNMVASNSADGFLRITNNTQTRVQKIKDDTPTKSFMGNLMGQNNKN